MTDHEKCFDTTMQVTLQLLEDLDTAHSLAVSLLVRAYLVESYDPIQFCAELDRNEVRADRYDPCDADLFARDYQAHVLVSKLPSKRKNDPTLRTKALEAFEEAELRCKDTNNRFRTHEVDRQLSAAGCPSIYAISRAVSMVLGRAPSLENLASKAYWTEGASYLLPKKIASSAEKSENGRSITIELARALNDVGVQFLTPLVNRTSGWFLVPGNLVDTVPKNIKTDRTIAKEPEINSMFQRAIGDHIRVSLKRVGIDLNDQRWNQFAALAAERLGLATIDLKAASDTICALLCEALLSPAWYDLLYVTRSHRGTLSSRKDAVSGKATWFEYEKISSMGNGFTFELESALFYSILIACGVEPSAAYVYGDDIVIPQDKVELVTKTLEILGFQTNIEKSFVSGTFFESCGVYSFAGTDVTPLKIKDLCDGKTHSIVLANKVRIFAHARRWYDGCDRRYLPSWRMCVHGIRADFRECRGPANSGLTLFCNINETKAKYSKKRGGLLYKTVQPRLSQREVTYPSLLTLRLFQLQTEGAHYNARGNASSVDHLQMAPSRGHSSIESWYNLGSWS